MPTFVHPLLLWGLAIVAAPVLIHLINMLRHRRVEWAAMEFLLVSQKKHRTWVIFKQLLLLLLRMLAIAAVVLLVAQPLLSNRLSRIFGRVKTHHVILLDDSYSMSDRWDDTSAFQEAKKVIERIGGEAAKQIQPQSFTLLRFSRMGKSGRPTQTDFLNEQVANGFPDRLKKSLDKCDVSQTDAGPVEPLKALDELLGDPEGERRILYVISDFRTRQWNDPDRREKTDAQMAGRRGRYPSDRLHRPRAAESVDRFACSPRKASARRACPGSWKSRSPTTAPRRRRTFRWS